MRQHSGPERPGASEEAAEQHSGEGDDDKSGSRIAMNGGKDQTLKRRCLAGSPFIEESAEEKAPANNRSHQRSWEAAVEQGKRQGLA